MGGKRARARAGQLWARRGGRGVGEGAAHRFAEEDDVGLDEPAALRAAHDICLLHRGLELRAVERAVAIDAVLVREAPVRFNYAVCGDVGLALERVDVLREAGVEVSMVREDLDEGVSGRRAEFTGVQLAREGINWWISQRCRAKL